MTSLARAAHRRRHCRWLLAITLTLHCLSSVTSAQDRDEDDDERPRFLPMLVAEYRDGKGLGFQRLEDVVSQRFEPLDPRLNPGSLHVTWSGRLLTPEEGPYRLSVHGLGQVRVTLNDHVVLDGATPATAAAPTWIEGDEISLPFGRHPLVIEYRGSHQGAISLYWSGPKFSREPVAAQFLLHDGGRTIDNHSQRGAELVHALRCASCHRITGASAPLAAPDLRHTGGALHEGWVRDWLQPHATGDSSDPGGATRIRRMPQFAWREGELDTLARVLAGETAAPSKPSSTADAEQLEAGKTLVHTVGCLACHQLGSLGAAGLFSGGELTHIAAKRTPDFLQRWLQAPESLNADHRMPLFPLSSKERSQVAAYLQTLGQPALAAKSAPLDDSLRTRGAQLLAAKGCVQCHRVSGARPSAPPSRSALTADSNWEDSCLGAPTAKHPGYQLPAPDAGAVRTYIGQLKPLANAVQPGPAPVAEGAQLMAEHNCTGCHQRNGSPGIGANLNDIAAAHPDWANRLPAMRPPSLNSVGDKLHDEALRRAIGRDAPRRRDWLDVRMPRFALSDHELNAIVAHLVQQDRIPGQAATPEPESSAELLRIAGRRLVTADGFGCTSCHAVGKVKPSKAPINAAGPDLAMLEQRIRREWFDRWVRNPARIVPRMEMPSVQTPIRGMLH
ncbi:MAG: c-type cytochrome, partial [Planctomycetales bacterium]|nr:c-type cytochrome [Planctomycetales bacterium]